MRNLFLLSLSYVLYLNWKPAYALILLFVTLVTYWGALVLNRNEQAKRKSLISIFVIIGLAPLLIFKYYNFINGTLISMLSSIGCHFQLPGLNLMVPIGISFFTFQALGYLWDVYYGKTDPEKNFLDYALFVSFFPSIVAGPINKASLVLPQIKALRSHFDYNKVVNGMKMLLWGLFMKVVVADRIALYVDTVLNSYENYTGMTCLFACFLYSIQIYADFAGYSLMAIGVGKTLGFDLTENFRRPYFSVSVTDFWRRWHISLSTWLKDYVYIPMGGSRCSKFKNYRNILLTFLVSGIWHGANWTFVFWGMLHGIFQVIEKALGEQKCKYGALGKSIKIGITYLLVSFAWIFFRMPTMSDALKVIYKIFDPNEDFSLYLDQRVVLLFILMGVSLVIINDVRDEFFPNKMKMMYSEKTWIRWISYVGLITLILLTGVLSSDQFIYANF